MSTLLPTPTFNPHIPVITSAGGTSVAYKDPNSPESILKKTTEIQVQSTVDTKYDIAIPAHVEGFQVNNVTMNIVLIILLLLLYIRLFGVRKYSSILHVLYTLIVICIILYLYKRYGVSGY
jgi:Ca2+/Na+ antiporter